MHGICSRGVCYHFCISTDENYTLLHHLSYSSTPQRQQFLFERLLIYCNSTAMSDQAIIMMVCLLNGSTYVLTKGFKSYATNVDQCTLLYRSSCFILYAWNSAPIPGTNLPWWQLDASSPFQSIFLLPSTLNSLLCLNMSTCLLRLKLPRNCKSSSWWPSYLPSRACQLTM